jgi:hypothetical protein
MSFVTWSVEDCARWVASIAPECETVFRRNKLCGLDLHDLTPAVLQDLGVRPLSQTVCNTYFAFKA